MDLPGLLPCEENLVLCNTAREYTVPARGSRQSLVKVWLNRRQSAEACLTDKSKGCSPQFP